ncbi:hypothetical protein [Alcanivorax quisquiliarum]|uniref:Lipoprotein n=1 Tax=Alcanivorax quisquiliarum TaxID=2933565 RepID=A0ABT0E5U3_9GAMM|nr:hypothetical protein [Alcanivorax quisquiliarum]MCK0537203.1 hypothetical protein [Alcanivorax quisquiliarum]
MKIINAPVWLALLALLGGCQALQGERDGDTYHAPAAAYSIDLGINTFRGKVTLDERCDAHGGSTTFWDGSGRQFRIDYLHAEDHPLAEAPRFASDMTRLNLVLNNYLRQRVASAPMVTSVEPAHRELLDTSSPRTLFAVVRLDIDPAREPGSNAVDGPHYYGFLLFRQGEMIYVLQHRQPVLMPEKMKSVLLRLAEALTIPGQLRSDTDTRRLRATLARMAPAGKQSPLRLCTPGN